MPRTKNPRPVMLAQLREVNRRMRFAVDIILINSGKHVYDGSRGGPGIRQPEQYIENNLEKLKELRNQITYSQTGLLVALRTVTERIAELEESK